MPEHLKNLDFVESVRSAVQLKRELEDAGEARRLIANFDLVHTLPNVKLWCEVKTRLWGSESNGDQLVFKIDGMGAIKQKAGKKKLKITHKSIGAFCNIADFKVNSCFRLAWRVRPPIVHQLWVLFLHA